MESSDLYTPYRRKTITDDITDDNTNTYKMFALKTQMWPHLSDGEYVAYRGVEFGNELWVCMNILQGGKRISLSEDRYIFLQNVINEFFDSDNNECLVYLTDNIRALEWPFPKNSNPTLRDGKLFVDLSDAYNYSELYESINIGLYYSLTE
jgi:hypothetical protein